MVVYVLANMSGETFDLNLVYVLTAVFSLVAFIGDLVLSERNSTN